MIKDDPISDQPLRRCRSCGAGIRWIITEMGKKAPVDADPVVGFRSTHVRDDGLPVGRVATVYVSHFATCPESKDWRK